MRLTAVTSVSHWYRKRVYVLAVFRSLAGASPEKGAAKSSFGRNRTAEVRGSIPLSSTNRKGPEILAF